MRQDDDRFFDDEDDNDLWDDELELNSNTTYSTEPTEYPGADYSITHTDSYEQESAHDDGSDDYYSDPDPDPDPQPKASERPRRERLFGRKAEVDDEEGNDYYDSDEEPEPEQVRHPKMPKLDPEDPDYWISDEEPGIGDIITTTGKRWKWWIAAVCTLLVALGVAWIWFLRPYSDNAVKYGYIIDMERRGSIIKTFEGTMIPYKELGDPDPLYFRKLMFSVDSDSVAALMKMMMLRCVPVRIEYETYHSPLPWKGEQTVIVLKADSADPRKILPPEYRPK